LIRGIYTATSALGLQEIKQNIWTNNLANIDTPGFKKELLLVEAAEEKRLYRFSEVGGSGYLGEMPFGVQPQNETATDFTQGRLESSGNPLDLAIEGDGFFVVDTPQGEAYTRAGNFTLSNEGVLITLGGYPVLGEGGEIALPEGGQIVVDQTGRVSMAGMEVDRIRVVDFDDRSRLQRIGENLFVSDQNTLPEESQNFRIRQGYLEKSNLDMIEGMVTMIEAFREYEMNQRLLQTQDEALDRAVNEIARLR